MNFNITNVYSLIFGLALILAWASVTLWINHTKIELQKQQMKLDVELKRKQNELNSEIQKQQQNINAKLIDNQIKQAKLQAETQRTINDQNLEIQKIIEEDKHKNAIENRQHQIEMKKLNQTTIIYSALIDKIESAFNSFVNQAQIECSNLTFKNYQNHQFSDTWQKCKFELIKYLPSAFNIIDNFEKEIIQPVTNYIEPKFANEPVSEEWFKFQINNKLAELIANIRQAILEVQLDSNFSNKMDSIH